MKKAIGKRLLALLLVVLMLCPQTYALAATDLSGHWCRGEIEAFLSKDLVRGYPDGGFHPDATVTRAEFIRMVNSTFGFVREGTATFTDVKEGDWYSADLAAAARTGWFSGMPDGSALPQATITRQEAAKLLVSMLEEKRQAALPCLPMAARWPTGRVTMWKLPARSASSRASLTGHTVPPDT